jgi:hypothetical protein
MREQMNTDLLTRVNATAVWGGAFEYMDYY